MEEATRNVKMLKDYPIAYADQQHPTLHLKDEEVCGLPDHVAHGLVRDKLAEYTDEDEQEPDDKEEEFEPHVTANVRNPDYGTTVHQQRAAKEIRKERKKNGSKTIQNEDEQRLTAARHFAQDRSYEGPAIEQVKNSDYLGGTKPAEEAKDEAADQQ